MRDRDVVVDVTRPGGYADGDVMSFFTSSTSNQLAAEARAGVTRHVALSVVGADRATSSGFMRAKVAQEDLVTASAGAHTVVRATQFFEFVRDIVDHATTRGVVRVTSATLQPIAIADLVGLLADLVEQRAIVGTVELAGPQAISLADLARRVLEHDEDPRPLIVDADAPYFGQRLDDHTLTPGPGARLGSTRFDDWLAAGNR